jgi:ubiquinone biosynthesis protein
VGIAGLPAGARAVSRVPQILRVLFKYGFGDVVNRIGLDSFYHALKIKLLPTVEESPFESLSTEERIRRALEELGPTFVKLGQILATRPDLIPMSLITELRKLQDKVPPFDVQGIKEHVEKELGRPLEQIFQSFDPVPLAAASIAQVHRAVLKDGRKAVLKIQRPNLERTIDTDLSIIAWLAELIEERVPEAKRYSPGEIVREFRKSIFKEIDFTREAYHMKRFARNFKDDPNVYVPTVYDEYTTPRILCEEFIDGIKVDSAAIKQRSGLDRETIAKTGIKFIIEQVFLHGFFHADPHPGNMFIIEGNKVCLIDYGMMGILDQERIDELLVFLVSLLTKDVDKMVRLFYKLGLIGEDTDVRGLRLDVSDLLERYDAVELAKVDVGQLLQQVFEVIVRHDILLPADLLLMGKALATIDGVGRDIYPELDPLGAFRPHILRIYIGRLTDPTYFTREARRLAEETWYLTQTAPRDLRLILHHLKKGDARLNLDLTGYADAVKGRAQAMNRLALSVVMASVIGGSCYMLVHSNLTRYVGEFPLSSALGLAGIGLAFFYGLVLLIGFVRSGGL